MTDLRTRAALAIIRRYPRRWRDRYEAEMRAIVEDHGVRARDVADLAFGALREHWRAPHGPDPGERPFLAAFWRGVIAFGERAIIVTAVGSCAYGIGWVVGLVTGPPAGTVSALFSLAVTAVGTWLALGAIHRSQQTAWLPPAQWPPAPTSSPFMTSAQRVMGAVVLAMFAVVGVAHEPLQWTVILQSYWLLSYPVLDRVLDPRGRRRALDAATRRYFNARERLKWARLELQRLESLSTPVDSAPMLLQQSEVDELRSEMAAAVDILRHPDHASPESSRTPTVS